MENEIEMRVLRSSSGQEFHFPFVVIDSPEKWPEASSFHHKQIIPNTRIALDLRGIAYSEFEKIQSEFIIPEEPDPKSATYQDQMRIRENMILAKEIALIEVSSGKKLPGATQDEKVEFMKAKGKSDVQGLVTAVQDYGCCWNDSNVDTPLINQYRSLCDSEVLAMPEEDLFSKWSDAKDNSYSFIMQRPHDNFITEFPLRGISTERDAEIRKATDPGEPECIPYKDPVSGRISGVRLNTKDPKWLAKFNRLQKKAMLMYIESTVPFTVPGATETERGEWIGKRLVGDIAALKKFIESNITSYGAALSFF